MKQLTFLFSFLLSGLLFAQPGSLDLNFGTGGFVYTDIGVDDARGRSLEILPDGSILVGGLSSNTAYHFTVAKYQPDGSLMPGFGFGSGTTHFNLESMEGNAWDLTVQSDDKILVTGQVMAASLDFGLARLNADGSIDNSYGGGDGRVVTDLGYDDLGVHVLELSDGKTLVTGLSYLPAGSALAMAKYNTDGTLDLNFDSDGFLTYAPTSNEGAFEAYELPDGKILACGYTYGGFSGTDFGLFRFLPDGTLDTGFGNNGLVIIDFGGTNNIARSLFIQSDGKILLAGESPSLFTLCRLHPDGTIDESFSFDGRVQTDVGATAVGVWDVLEQPDGKILLAGYADLGGSFVYDFIAVRYLADGTLDGDFGQNGILRIDASQIGSQDVAFEMALQPDGLIVMAGYAYVNGRNNFALIRVTSGLNVGTVDLGVEQNSLFVFPNPIRERTIQLQYELANSQEVSIQMFDQAGCRISLVQDAYRTAGEHSETLTLPTDLPTGNYWLKVQTKAGMASTQITVVN